MKPIVTSAGLNILAHWETNFSLLEKRLVEKLKQLIKNTSKINELGS